MSEPAVAAAVEAIDRWASVSRGEGLRATRGELRSVQDRCRNGWASDLAIPHGGVPTSPLALVPEIVRRIIDEPKRPEFKSVKYALACIDNRLDQFRHFGSHPRDGPAENRSAENAEIVARVLARQGGTT